MVLAPTNPQPISYFAMGSPIFPEILVKAESYRILYALYRSNKELGTIQFRYNMASHENIVNNICGILSWQNS